MTNAKYVLMTLVALAVVLFNVAGVRAICSLTLNYYVDGPCSSDTDCPSSYASGDNCYYNKCGCCASGLNGFLFQCPVQTPNACAYDSQDSNKPTCNECYTATCTDGWGCEGDPDGTVCVTPQGLGGKCQNGICELRGCEYDSECGIQAGTNRLGKCDVKTGTCSYPACSSNAECGSGYCCIQDPNGPKDKEGNCVPKGIYNPTYLCDPPEWTSVEQVSEHSEEPVKQTEQPKNIIRKIFDIFLAL